MAERQRFSALLSRIARRVTAMQSSEICCGDLTLEQFQTLRTVQDSREALSLGRLSEEMGVDLSTMSRNVTLLERNEYLLRARSADDGRVVTVKLTPKGRRALATLSCGEDQTFRSVYEKMPAAVRPNVVRALEVLEDSLNALKGDPCCLPAAPKAARAKRAARAT